MEHSVKDLSVVRIGDQVLFQPRDSDEGKWFAEGYYQLKEIADMFGDRLASFTAFGRIMQVDSNVDDLYEIPTDSVPHFTASGPRVARKGILAYLCALPPLAWKVRKVATTHDVIWPIVTSLSGIFASLLAPKDTIKVMQIVGERNAPLRQKYPRLAPLLVPIFERLAKLALRRANLAVFASNYLKEKYGQDLECPVIVANESRLRPWMINKVDKREIHSPLRVLYVGRLVPEKGVQFLIQAIKSVSKTRPCELWVVGSGPYKEELQTQATELGIKELVEWKGWIPWGDELFAIMRKADMLVMPSLLEGVGLVHIEAMSQSLPVIASRVDGIPEIVKNEISGLLVEPGDANAITKAIRKVAEDRNLRQKVVNRGLEIARQNTFEAQTGRVIKRICQLTLQKGSRLD